MEKLKPYAISLLGGIIYSLAWPTFLGKGLVVTAIPGMALLLWQLFQEENLRKKFYTALAFCVPFTAIGFYWIPATLAEFGQLPYIVALLMGTMFTFISAPHLFLFVLLIHFGLQHPRIKPYESRFTGITAVALGALFVFIEYHTPQQFSVMIGQPWARLGEYLGLANIGGLPLYGFFSFLAAIEIANRLRLKKFSGLNLAFIALFIVSNPFLKNSNPEKDVKPLNIRLVQANISNFLKVESEAGGYASVSEVLSRYTELSEEPYSYGELDLLVWPETAYPFGMESLKDDFKKTEIPAVFKKIASQHNADLFIGGYDVISSKGDYYQSEYNSNFHINPRGQLEGVYHKHILIPFGETLPLGPFNKYLSKYIENISFFSEGETYPLFKTSGGVGLINTICYEILKPEFVRTYLNQQTERPYALVNLTNDSWYGDTSEPEQHLFLTVWRALEFDLPIIRSTNTGISSFINVDGQEVKRLGIGVTGNLDLSVQLGQREATLFQKFGFWIMLPIWFALFIFHWLLIRFKR